MSDLLTDNDLQVTRATEPSKRWRNWWRVTQEFISIPTGKLRVVGEVYGAPVVWPSREIAEQKARDTLATNRGYAGGQIKRSPDIYLGAFPDGEHP